MNLAADRRPTAATAVRPAANNQPSVPTQERRRRHEERPPACARQQPTRRSEKKAVGWCKPRSTRLTPKHGQLVPQHKYLKLLELVRA
jgi:hypothetical protein